MAKKISAGEWFRRHKYSVGYMVVGHTTKRIEEFLFDWLLYGFVITWATAEWGTLQGSLVAFLLLAPVSAALSWAYVIFYDWTKRDWLGLEALKDFHETEANFGWFGHFARRVIHWGRFPAFIMLSIHGDPFITSVYFRKGAGKYRRFTRRDWSIFWASVVVSNAYWTLRWTIIIEIARYLWKFIQATFA